MIRNALAVLALGTATLALAGCGSRTTTVQANGATIVQNGASTTVTTPQGTAHVGPAQSGAAYPGNLPAYPNAMPGADVSGSSAGNQGRVVMFTTSDEPAQVLDFYTTAGQQAGLQLLQRTNAGPVASLAFMHANEAITVTATGTPAGTQVQIAAGTR